MPILHPLPLTSPLLYEACAAALPSPCFIVDKEKLSANAAILGQIQERTGVKILLALKAFSSFRTFPLLSRALGEGGCLYGVCASSVDEAKLGRDYFGGEIHAFAAAYSKADMTELLSFADHIVFNSFGQWQRFKADIESVNMQRAMPVSIGLRLNPEHSEGAVAMYDPCSAISRLGIRKKSFRPDLLEGISGFHFHTLCEQDADALVRTWAVVEKNFGQYFKGIKWLNFGGGHHITRPGYNVDLLCDCVMKVQEKYGVQVYLEPGEAVALNAGYFMVTVLDVIEADVPIALVDASAACHTPDVLEMPYTPHIGAVLRPAQEGEGAFLNLGAAQMVETGAGFACRVGGKSCLAGDFFGDYVFSQALEPGDILFFEDMAIYSMVKTNTFNGLRLPSLAEYGEEGALLVKSFSYEDFKGRLG